MAVPSRMPPAREMPIARAAHAPVSAVPARTTTPLPVRTTAIARSGLASVSALTRPKANAMTRANHAGSRGSATAPQTPGWHATRPRVMRIAAVFAWLAANRECAQKTASAAAVHAGPGTNARVCVLAVEMPGTCVRAIVIAAGGRAGSVIARAGHAKRLEGLFNPARRA